MIGQYLSNTNESAIVSILQKTKRKEDFDGGQIN